MGWHYKNKDVLAHDAHQNAKADYIPASGTRVAVSTALSVLGDGRTSSGSGCGGRGGGRSAGWSSGGVGL